MQIGVVPVTVPTAGNPWLVMLTLSYLAPHVFVTVYFTVMVPGVSPVMIPVEPMDRMPPPYGVFQVPPAGEPVSVVELPTQRSVTVCVTVDVGKGFTEIGFFTVVDPHVLVTVYLTVSGPDTIPVTTPPLTLARTGLVTLHTPPAVASVSVSVDAPTQTLGLPDMTATVGIVPVVTVIA
jgi:hypothetical protein